MLLAGDIGGTKTNLAIYDPQSGLTPRAQATFRRDGDGIVDEQTGSRWNVLGQAIAGPLTGAQLAPIVHGDHFWFAWTAFRPDPLIYRP